MKTQTFLATIAFATLGAFSGTALAGPDFSTIERGRAAKKAEQVKQTTAAKKCYSDEVVAPSASK
jgi:hypothetical protein